MLSFRLVISLLTVITEVLSFQKLFPDLNPVLSIDNDTLCSQHVGILTMGLEEQALWAMRMGDSSAQGSSGALYGNIWQLGNFDECLNVDAPFPPKYCFLAIEAQIQNQHDHLSVWNFVEETKEKEMFLSRGTLHAGVCVPASCSASQLEEAFQDQLDVNNNSQVQYKVNVNPDLCTSTVQVGPFHTPEILFWSFCALLLLLSALGTIFRKQSPSNIALRFVCCFSIPCNYQRLVKVSHEESTHPLAVLHGIKVFSIILVFYGHRTGIPLGSAITNYQEVEEQTKTAHNMFMPQADLVVDTFFFISGVLATYFLYHVVSKGKVKPIHAIVARITRIAPSYYFLVWYQASAALRLGSGPLWKFIQIQEKSACVNYWWANIIFVNNYLPGNKICHVHSWFLPCDIHFFILALILVQILIKKPLFGKIVLSILTVLTPIIPAYIVYTYSLDPIILFYDSFLSNPRSSVVFDMLYIKSHVRVTVYLIGVVVGYFLCLHSSSKYKMTKVVTTWNVVIGISLLFTPMAVGGLYYQEEKPSLAFSAVYSALRRPLWALGLTVLLMVHRFGPQNVISRVMASHPALVLSKLTFTTYLIHYLLILGVMSKTRAPNYFSVFDLVVNGSGDLITSTAYAAILYLFLELPFKRLIRELAFSKQIDKCNNSVTKPNSPQEVYTAKL